MRLRHLSHSFEGNYAIKRFNLTLQTKRTFSFQYPIYANNHTIFLYLQFRFGILEPYAKKQFMCLIGMNLAEAVCSCLRPLAKFDWV